jgi:hypothetical protein
MKPINRLMVLSLVLAAAACGSKQPDTAGSDPAASRNLNLGGALDSSDSLQVASAVELGRRTARPARLEPTQPLPVQAPVPEPEPNAKSEEVMAVHQPEPAGAVQVSLLTPGQTAAAIPIERGVIRISPSRGNGAFPQQGPGLAVGGGFGDDDNCTPSPHVGSSIGGRRVWIPSY